MQSQSKWPCYIGSNHQGMVPAICNNDSGKRPEQRARLLSTYALAAAVLRKKISLLIDFKVCIFL